MREIKFRVWSKTWESMHYLDKLDGWLGRASSDLWGIKTNHAFLQWTDKRPHEEFAKYDSNNFVIEQYTGLKDKTGKEIYEGDIIKFGATTHGYPNVKDDWTGAVEWTHSSWGIKWINRRLDETWSHEVIGNIHENKELLK